MTDTLNPKPPDPRNESRAVNKNARPAGRRFQSFTPPDLAALGRKPEDLAPTAAPVIQPRPRKVRRRDLLVALSLAVAGGVVVAAIARVHVAERDAIPSAASYGSAAAPVASPAAPASANPAPDPASDPAADPAPEVPVDGPPPARTAPALPAPKAPSDPSVLSTTPVAVPSAVPATASANNNPDADNRPPGPNPLAPVEPPF